MYPLWMDLLALAIYGPVIVLLHELGHAALARAGGYRITDFAIGMGRPLWSTSLRGGIVFHVDRWFFLGGSCTAIPSGPPSARRAWFHLGGLLAQGLLGLALLPLTQWTLGQQIFAFNALVWLHNAVPWRLGAFASDGWHALDALGGGARAANIVRHRVAIERMTERARTIGSPLGEAYGRVCLAWCDVVAGRPKLADDLFSEDPPATTLEAWVDALYHYVKAEWERAGTRPLAALRTTREALLSVDLAAAPDADALLALAEARALVDLDASAQALRALSRTAGVGGAIGWQAHATRVWATLDGEVQDLELATRALLRRLHEPSYDPADGAMALWSAADELDRGARADTAREAREGARALARHLLAEAPVECRASLVRRMGAVAGLGQRPTAASNP